MNNPLEAVTQAVNSLVTALKLPDESAKANEVLGEMSFPQFSRLLPYRDYNQESGLFMNDTTMGFMLEAIPINGANESIVEALDHMLRTKLPRGVPFCIHLMSSQLVGDRIEYGLREFSWSGEQAERFNAITRAYYMNAAATQFPLPEGMNLPLTLRHYRVFFSYCSPSKKKSRADILEMENLVKIIRASLQGASITTQAVDAQAFIDIVGEMINHNPDSLYRACNGGQLRDDLHATGQFHLQQNGDAVWRRTGIKKHRLFVPQSGNRQSFSGLCAELCDGGYLPEPQIHAGGADGLR